MYENQDETVVESKLSNKKKSYFKNLDKLFYGKKCCCGKSYDSISARKYHYSHCSIVLCGYQHCEKYFHTFKQQQNHYSLHHQKDIQEGKAKLRTPKDMSNFLKRVFIINNEKERKKIEKILIKEGRGQHDNGKPGK